MPHSPEFFIEIQNVSFSFASSSGSRPSTPPLPGWLTLRIRNGEFVALRGEKGSGKSTLGRLINGLQLPTDGVVRINGMDTRDEIFRWEIRRIVGMLFSEPDNQIIGTTVAEDVAFGPENLELASKVIQKRVHDALQIVGMTDYADSAPHLLNAIQKLKVALAGVLAMQPLCLVVDESTTGLNSTECREFTQLLRKLNLEWGITVLFMTTLHLESGTADRTIVLHQGRIICDETVASGVTPC